ncbi:MAG: sulfatase-like hydrolase/transferase [Planctomycetales bacterium]|nr:sulfatase-like hydrolase/transferase [Planctomycetales bacterium]
MHCLPHFARRRPAPAPRVVATVVAAVFAAVVGSVFCAGANAAEPARPNILWLSCEDISPHLGCYGDAHAKTPILDRLATQGVRYSHAFTTAGVCAPCRSGIISGLYQTSLGTHHMRCNAVLPPDIKPFPAYLRDAGYYCTNNSKQDYQFKTPRGVWDESSGKAHWRNRQRKDQPFFAVFNFTGCHESGIAGRAKYESVTKQLRDDERQDAAALKLPPYYPDTPVVREDWKRNYELITAMDHWAGGLLHQLEEDGLAEQTIVFFWSDHGVGLPRAKRWLYDSGTHIPLIVRIPAELRKREELSGQAEPGAVSHQLVSSVDFGATVLRLAGLAVPDHMQGQPFLGADLPEPRRYVYGGRDRMDERYDIIRMVRNHRFKYLRNYEPLKAYYQYINTAEKGATMRELRRVHEAGQLPAAAEQFFATRKPTEELYDCEADPHELNNLANDPQYQDVLVELRRAHREWSKATKDVGLIPEPIIAEREEQLGSRYGLLRQPDGDTYNEQLVAIATAASEGPTALPQLARALTHEDSVIRFWGATGLGNIGNVDKSAGQHAEALRALLTDPSAAVRIAAARALCQIQQPQQALPVLTRELLTGAQWERLHAAIVLDEIDEQARPAIAELKKALAYQPGFHSDGKYRVRVVNRALNELLGTDHQVP